MQAMTFRKNLTLAAAYIEKNNELKRLIVVLLVCCAPGLCAQGYHTNGSHNPGTCLLGNYHPNVRIVRIGFRGQHSIVDMMDPYCIKLAKTGSAVSQNRDPMTIQQHGVQGFLLAIFLTGLLLYWKRVNCK